MLGKSEGEGKKALEGKDWGENGEKWERKAGDTLCRAWEFILWWETNEEILN